MKKFLNRIRTGKRPSTTETAPQTTSSSATSHSVGYETLFEGAAPIVADIIFVHGLRGHRRDTWTKDGICWPKDLLPKEEALSNVRILSFGYDSNVVEFGGHASQKSLFKHSVSLVNDLCRERNDDAGRNIIFVAHSLGGLIVKDALHFSDMHRTTQPDLTTILDATRGIVFLGTPHRGSSATTLPKLIASVIQAVQDVNVDLIRDLERESQTLDRIGFYFGQIMNLRTFMVFSFEEELAMRGGKVVDGGSAIIGDAYERRDTIHADHVNMVKFSDPTDEGYRKVSYAIKLLLREKKLASAGQRLSDVTTFYDVPPLHVPYYVERKGLLTRIDELFLSSNNSRQRIVVLLGMGGTGKTQLALKYCRHLKSSGTFRAIFWLDASSRNALEGSMMVICKQLVPERIVDNPRDGVELVRTTLSGWSSPWFLVFDNFDNPSEVPDILKFFPDSSYGSILITSRAVGSMELGNAIELNQMEKDEGLELLLHSSQADAKDVDVVERILARLGYLPLAIDQVRAYISRQRLGLVDFEEEYEKRKRNFMKETPQIWQYRRALPGMEEETSLSLLTTWEMSLELLDVDTEFGGKLRDVLTLFAFLHHTSISEVVFGANIGDSTFAGSPMAIFEEKGKWNHDKFERAAICMQDHSLVQFSRRSGDEIVVSLHSMVSEWLRLRLDKGVLSRTLKIVAMHLKKHLEFVELDYIYQQEALSHMDRIVELGGESDELTDIYSSFGKFYAKHARLKEAERMYDRALAGYEKALGPEHISSLNVVNELGDLYTDQGRFGDAERMYDRALAGKEKALGREHTSVLNTVYSLGDLYCDLGRLADGETMYDRALAGYEKALGPGHTSVLSTVDSLGNLYSDLGRLAEAETMYDRALAGYEKALGPGHTSTLNVVHNLGNLYSDEGRLADAETMYDRALAGKEKALGPGHTSVFNTVHSLGNLYSKLGRLADAEAMYGRALAGYEKALEAGHTSTLNAFNNLGNLYFDQGRLADAETMYDRALAGYEKALGPGHTSTLNAINNVGNLYCVQGRLADAEEMYCRALAGYEKALGPQHTSTLETATNLANLYSDQGRLADADRILRRTLAGTESVSPQ